MQPLSTDFLAALAKRYDLSPEQTEALIKRLGDKDNEQKDAEALHISINALRSRMTGVYTKFSIGSGGPGKLRKLHDLLLNEHRRTSPTGSESLEPEPDLDALVQTIRAQVHGDIQARCGTMRVLDMEQPIGLGDIYTSVNILEKLSGRRRLSLDDLLQNCDTENFDRFLLGQVRQKRVPGLEAVERYDQLMILGKPGAGKTTFMKRLAILCNEGEFQPQQVPIFVTLKDYAEAKGKPRLQTHIQHQWKACGVEVANSLSRVLGNGHALVLLDGLDEVYETDHDRVLQDIKTFAYQFRDCQCVITCRIAAREYTFEQFTEVEVADFDPEQITEFTTKWFTAKQDPKKAETFIQRLKDNNPIQELATNPLLLTLLCLIFGEAADFPTNRAELYKEGLDVLLKKWDGKRNIERDQVYQKLSLKRKEDLLSQLAFETFERGDYFFKQSIVEQYIIKYIRNLPDASDNEEVLQLDSESVLKSIEAQHGLLVERAKGIYSFSHLTFQEYFATQHIISPTSTLNHTLKKLATHITKKRYREIFLLTSAMLPTADFWLIIIKNEADSIITEDLDLQMLLRWIHQKSKSIDLSYRLCSVRAFYLAISLAYSLASARDRALIAILDLEIDFLLPAALNLDMASVNTLASALEVEEDNEEFVIEGDEDRFLDNFEAFELEQELSAIDTTLNLMFDRKLDIGKEKDLYFVFDRFFSINQTLDEAIRQKSDHDIDFAASIIALKNKLPEKISVNAEDFRAWWIQSGVQWAEELRFSMIDFRQINHDWCFTISQKEKLQKYYAANKLLVDCLNSDCYVTKPTRQYIEDTLLLPLSEIEKYPVPDAIANL